MRIGILTDVYRSGFSGVANHVMLLKQSLAELGQEVYIFSFEQRNIPEPEPDVIFSPGITLAANYPFGFQLSGKAKKIIQCMDILHIHQPFASGYVALQQHKKNGVPLVFTSHTRYDLHARAYLPWLPTNLSLPAIQHYMRYFASRMSLMIAPAPEMETMLRSWRIQTPVQVIPNGVSLCAFAKNTAKQAGLHTRLSIPDDYFLFLYAGRIAPEKNIPFLLDAFIELLKQTNRAALVLAGGGPKFDEIQQYIQHKNLDQNVFMIGRVEYSDMPSIMHSADAFVTASKSEVHPLTIIEASASSLPVIGLHGPGVSSIVVDQVTGFLCKDDVQDLAQKMVYLVQNWDLARRFGENAARHAAAYSDRTTAQRILNAYQGIIHSAPPPSGSH